MTTHHLAIDIGASSGRLILGWMENGKIRLREIHRFANGTEKRDGRLCWDVEHFFLEILAGLKKCAAEGKRPASIGVDTWGVDFVLLDADGNRLGEAVSYRDGRTQGVDEKIYRHIGEMDLYRRNGIQKQSFNTIYQLYALKLQQPELLERAASLLLMPEYLNFLLSGRKLHEYTNATTTQLVAAETRDWDWPLLDRLELPRRLFGKMGTPGTLVGTLRPEIRAAVGFDAEVVLPATHDTASAVLATPFEENAAIFLSSGTWSLMGVERNMADCGVESHRCNFASEGGYGYRYRFLKNIMGLWMIQSIRRELGEGRSFQELIELAEGADDFPSRVDVNHPSFLSPSSMIGAMREYCRDNGCAEPRDEAEVIACAYRSLAGCYADTAREIDRITGVRHRRIHIVGGGSRDRHLNRLTAVHTGMEVFAGPVEATAIGNILAQMIRAGSFADVAAARAAVRESFPVERIAAE